MSQVELKEMLAAAVHFGHQTHKWNPRMKKYIYGVKDGIHIFNLEKTFDHLQKAQNFLKQMVEEGKTILFVSTKQQSSNSVEKVAKKCGMPFVTHKWIGGLLTNFSTIKKRIKYYTDLLDENETGKFEKYTKKEASQLKKELEKLETAFSGLKMLKRRPDALVVLDCVRDNIAVKEAKRLKIPIVGIVDTNANPDEIDYPIPGNDDAVKAIHYFTSKFEDTILNAKSKSSTS